MKHAFREAIYQWVQVVYAIGRMSKLWAGAILLVQGRVQGFLEVVCTADQVVQARFSVTASGNLVSSVGLQPEDLGAPHNGVMLVLQGPAVLATAERVGSKGSGAHSWRRKRVARDVVF